MDAEDRVAEGVERIAEARAAEFQWLAVGIKKL